MDIIIISLIVLAKIIATENVWLITYNIMPIPWFWVFSIISPMTFKKSLITRYLKLLQSSQNQNLPFAKKKRLQWKIFLEQSTLEGRNLYSMVILATRLFCHIWYVDRESSVPCGVWLSTFLSEYFSIFCAIVGKIYKMYRLLEAHSLHLSPGKGDLLHHYL